MKKMDQELLSEIEKTVAMGLSPALGATFLKTEWISMIQDRVSKLHNPGTDYRTDMLEVAGFALRAVREFDIKYAPPSGQLPLPIEKKHSCI